MKESLGKKLVEVEKNTAGYSVYRREPVTEIEETVTADLDEDASVMKRRHFLQLFSGALTSAAISGLPAFSALRNNAKDAQLLDEVEYDSLSLGALSLAEQPIKSELMSGSRYFYAAVEAYAQAYEKEVPAVLGYARKATINDPQQRNRMQYVSEELDAKGVPQAAMEELKTQFKGLGFTESRYDAQRVSKQGAKGVLQIIPSTWKELTGGEENIFSLKDQTKAAGDLLSQTYSYLNDEVGNELRAIKDEFFDGDTEAFEKYFIAPVLINSYNAGMGTMSKLIAWFSRTYATQEKTAGILGEEMIVSGYDVFFAMAMRGKTDQPVPLYKEEASTYTAKVYGATMTLKLHENEEFTA